MNIFIFLIIFFGVVNLVRMTMFIVGSDIYSYKARKLAKTKKKHYVPNISIVIPAHNEEKTVLRAVRSIVQNKYPLEKRDIILVDDGSTDRTTPIIERYKKSFQVQNLTVLYQKNRGKASALNNAIKNHAKGELIMCLDSDSFLAKDGLKKAVAYFNDPRVAALSANIKIIPSKSLLNIIQQFEYLISYQMKRAQTVFNIEYIIGGIGSTFRKSILDKVGYYDDNTVTEDIDLTMKILQLGNRETRVIYGADVIAYTESVLDIQSLIRQRYRWKWGRAQTFLKNKNLFFKRDPKFTKGLTHLYLPYAVFGDIAFLLEPLLVSIIFYIVFMLGDLATLISTVTLMSLYLIINILLESTLNTKAKIKYVVMAPFMYLFFYVLSLVEYVALIKTLVRLPALRKSISKGMSRWQHVERIG